MSEKGESWWRYSSTWVIKLFFSLGSIQLTIHVRCTSRACFTRAPHQGLDGKRAVLSLLQSAKTLERGVQNSRRGTPTITAHMQRYVLRHVPCPQACETFAYHFSSTFAHHKVNAPILVFSMPAPLTSKSRRLFPAISKLPNKQRLMQFIPNGMRAQTRFHRSAPGGAYENSHQS